MKIIDEIETQRKQQTNKQAAQTNKHRKEQRGKKV